MTLIDPTFDLDSYGLPIRRIDKPTEIPALPETEPGSIDPDREAKLCETIRVLAAREQELIEELRRVQEIGLDQRDVDALKEEAVEEMLSGMIYGTPFPMVIKGRRFRAQATRLDISGPSLMGNARTDIRSAAMQLILKREVSEEELKAEREALERLLAPMKNAGIQATAAAASIAQASKQFQASMRAISASLATPPVVKHIGL